MLFIFSINNCVRIEYFKCYNVRIKAKPLAGYEFDRWEINCKNYYDVKMNIDVTMADCDENISIVLYVNKVKNPMIQL